MYLIHRNGLKVASANTRDEAYNFVTFDSRAHGESLASYAVTYRPDLASLWSMTGLSDPSASL